MSRGRQKRGSPVDGMFLLDKPPGYSSNQALQKVKALFDARKAGHTGSLDPIATGLLPICFGETTKISGLFLNADKTYDVTVRLGVTTETGDVEGEVLTRAPVDTDIDKIKSVLNTYRGSYDQVPPMYSALKKNGQPLYKLARQGIIVEREARPVTVYSLILTDWQEDLLSFTVCCSRGFYVRTLAEEIGRDLGCGGHVETLRRSKVGDFSIEQAHTVEQIEALGSEKDRRQLLLPTDRGLSHLPEVRLPENLVRYLRVGQSIRAGSPSLSAPQTGLVRLYSESSHFLGLGEITPDKKLMPKRMFNS